jgi:hypothetical protein
MLAMAKKGGVTDCFVVAAFGNATVISGWGGNGSSMLLLGGIEAAKTEFIKQNLVRDD